MHIKYYGDFVDCWYKFYCYEILYSGGIMKSKIIVAIMLCLALVMQTGCKKDIESDISLDNYETAVDVIKSSVETLESQYGTIKSSIMDESIPTIDISLDSDYVTSLDEWLKENLWNIIGNINLVNISDVCDYINPRSAKLYIADIDGDGNFELIHSLFTGTYTTIESVYKLNETELYFYGYYYSGLYTEDSGFIDGIYTNGSEQRYFCSRYVTSGGMGQPYWIQIYEMKFGIGIELVPIISSEWSPLSYNSDEYCLVNAEYDGVTIYDENEYNQWLSDFFGDYIIAGDILNIINSIDVPFSIGAKDITSDEKVQEIIDWICIGLTKNGEFVESESNTY